MQADTLNPVTIEEQYESATNTSNLKQESERRMPADVLRDMAMSTDRVGGRLLRLRSQWESTSRPDRQQPRSLKEFLRLIGDKDKAVAAYTAERLECEASYRRALTGLANRLPDLDAIRDELIPVVIRRGWGKPADPSARAERAEKRELDDAMLEQMHAEVAAAGDDEARQAAQASLNHWIIEVGRIRGEEDREDRERARGKIGQVVRYWLDQTCHGCGGTRWELMANTNRQSTKVCRVCAGSGFAQVPHGSEGKWLANYMDQCVHRYGQKLRTRRRALASIPPIDRLSKRMQPDDLKD